MDTLIRRCDEILISPDYNDQYNVCLNILSYISDVSGRVSQEDAREFEGEGPVFYVD